MELILVGILITQLCITAICLKDYVEAEKSFVECLSLFIFWPLYLLKNIVNGFLLVFNIKD